MDRLDQKLKTMSYQYSPTQSTKFSQVIDPAVTVLEKETKGMLSINVESDIMAYILYCHYEEFVRIQQTYHVTITWSGRDNNVIICATSRTNASKLHLATHQFIFFYQQIAEVLVAVPLSDHVTNITLHQYHKVVYEVKRSHPKAMIKDINTSGRIALYCPIHEMHAATSTFLQSLSGKNFLQVSFPVQKKYGNSLPKSKYSQNLPQHSKRYKIDHYHREINNQHSKSFANKSSSPLAHIKSTSTYSQPNYHEFEEDTDAERTDSIECAELDYDNRSKPLKTRFSDETGSSNGSSGYGSHNGTMNRHFGYHDVMMKQHSYSGVYGNSQYRVLPRISPRRRLDYALRQSHNDSPKKYKSLSPDYSVYYYNEIQQSGEVSPPNYEQRPSTQGSFSDDCRIQGFRNNDRSNEKLTQQKQHHFENDANLRTPDAMKVTTPTGLVIEVQEGDVTEDSCDAMVNVTNQQLHVAGELAWAVAKHGSFEIPKLTKLHIAMHGPLMESKVMMTPSVGLPSNHIIHAVTPKWNGKKQRKSKKLLYNTYKNIFNAANLELKAKSIALPVIGLENAAKSGDSFPFHVATEVMYQALVAFIKLGSLSLRHIRYIGSDPDRVNLIMTSIKPKLENVTYDARFLKQIKPQSNLAMKSVVIMDSNRTACGGDSSGNVTSPRHSLQNRHLSVRSLPRLKDPKQKVKRR